MLKPLFTSSYGPASPQCCPKLPYAPLSCHWQFCAPLASVPSMPKGSFGTHSGENMKAGLFDLQTGSFVHKLKLMCTKYKVICWKHVEVISIFVGGIFSGSSCSCLEWAGHRGGPRLCEEKAELYGLRKICCKISGWSWHKGDFGLDMRVTAVWTWGWLQSGHKVVSYWPWYNCGLS